MENWSASVDSHCPVWCSDGVLTGAKFVKISHRDTQSIAPSALHLGVVFFCTRLFSCKSPLVYRLSLLGMNSFHSLSELYFSSCDVSWERFFFLPAPRWELQYQVSKLLLWHKCTLGTVLLATDAGYPWKRESIWFQYSCSLFCAEHILLQLWQQDILARKKKLKWRCKPYVGFLVTKMHARLTSVCITPFLSSCCGQLSVRKDKTNLLLVTWSLFLAMKLSWNANPESNYTCFMLAAIFWGSLCVCVYIYI